MDHEDDDPDDGDVLPKMTQPEIERLARVAESIPADHFDLEALKAELKRLGEIRERRSEEVLESLPPGDWTEDELVEFLERSGAYDEFKRELRLALVIKAIRLARQRRN